MPIKVNLPDKDVTLQFPDDMSMDDIQGAIDKEFYGKETGLGGLSQAVGKGLTKTGVAPLMGAGFAMQDPTTVKQTMQSTFQGLQTGSASVMEGANRIAQAVGNKLQGITEEEGEGPSVLPGIFNKSINTLGRVLGEAKWSADLWQRAAEASREKLPERAKVDIIEKPSAVLDPVWLAANVAETLPSFASAIVPGIGAAKGISVGGKILKLGPETIHRLAKIGGVVGAGFAGGSMEGASTYQKALERGATEEEAFNAGTTMTLASAGLNAISFGRILGGAKGNKLLGMLVSGFTEAGTELAEEPTEALILGDDPLAATKQGLNVVPAAFLLGFLGAGAVEVGKKGSISDFETKIQTLDTVKLDKKNDLWKRLAKDNYNKGNPEAAQTLLDAIVKDIDEGKSEESIKAKEKLMEQASAQAEKIFDSLPEELEEGAVEGEGIEGEGETVEGEPVEVEGRPEAEKNVQDKIRNRITSALGFYLRIKKLEAKGKSEAAVDAREEVVGNLITAKENISRMQKLYGTSVEGQINSIIQKGFGKLSFEEQQEIVAMKEGRFLKKYMVEPIQEESVEEPEQEPIKEEPVGQEVQEGIPSSIIEREELGRPIQVKEPSEEEVTTGGVLQTQEEGISRSNQRLQAYFELNGLETSKATKKLQDFTEPQKENLLRAIRDGETSVTIHEVDRYLSETEEGGLEDVEDVEAGIGGYGLDDVLEREERLAKEGEEETLQWSDEDYLDAKMKIRDVFDFMTNETGAIDLEKQLETAEGKKLIGSLQTIAGYHIERGAESFKTWSNRMVERFGYPIKRFLSNAWNQAVEGIRKGIKVGERIVDDLKGKGKDSLVNKETYDDALNSIAHASANPTIWNMISNQDGSINVEKVFKGQEEGETSPVYENIIGALSTTAVEHMQRKTSYNTWRDGLVKKFGNPIKPFTREAWRLGEEKYRIAMQERAILIKSKGNPNEMATKSIALKGRGKNRKPTPSPTRFVTDAQLKSLQAMENDLTRTPAGKIFSGLFLPQDVNFEEMDNTNPGITSFNTLLQKYEINNAIMKKELQAIVDKMKPFFRHSKVDTTKLGVYATLKDDPKQLKTLKAAGIESVKVTDLNVFEQTVYDLGRKYYNLAFDAVNETRVKLGKARIPYRTNYFTFSRMEDYLNSQGLNMISAGYNDIIAALYNVSPETVSKEGHPNVKFDYVRRNPKEIKPNDLRYDKVFFKYVQHAKRYEHLGPLVGEVRELTGTFDIGWNEKTKKPIKFSMADTSPAIANQLNRWADAVMGVKNPKEFLSTVEATQVEKVINFFTGNIAAYTMQFAFRSALIQPTANLFTASYIGPKWFAKGSVEWFNKDRRKFAMENSPHLQGRTPDVVLEDTELLGTSLPIDIKNAGYYMLQTLDIVSAEMGWLGAYDRLTQLDGLGHEEAVKEADRIIRKTQGAAAKGFRANIQRTAAGKALTLFQTFNIGEFAYLIREVATTTHMTKPGKKTFDISQDEKRKERVSRIVTLMIGSAILNFIYEDLLGLTSPLPSPIRAMIKAADEDDDVAEVVFKGIKEYASQVPVVGGGVNYGAGVGGAVGDYYKDIMQYVADKPGPKKHWLELVGKGVGFPGGNQLRKSIKAYKDRGDIYDVVMGTYVGHKRVMLDALVDAADSGEGLD